MDSSQPGLGHRYELQESLGAGGMGVVYRALDRLSGQTVALKRVTMLTDQMAFNGQITLTTGSLDKRVALAHEFKILASLRHPNIISVLDYGFDELGQPYFTMDLLRDVSTIGAAGAHVANSERLRLLVEMLHALAYLHRRGVLHRDLKPANVLVVDGHVKLLDFGLALDAARSKSGGISGTLAYIAPEILRNEPPTLASDLYAVGVIAYEMFTGQHPFGIGTQGEMIQKTLTQMPDTANIPTPFRGIIQSLLAKDPAERPPNAQAVIDQVMAASDKPLTADTRLIRESFLQAARFVGRDAELGTLSHALKTMLALHGGAWLIGGESGVGKSRLLEELRALALVEGAVVLRGNAVSEGGVSYQLWRDVLPWLAAFGELTKAEASILKPFVPDIERLYGAPVIDAPEIDPQARQIRLLATIQDILNRIDTPLVLLLEDIQWAGEESVALLSWLSEIAADRALLIVASYRNDEAPDLPARLPRMKPLKLARLPAPAIAELSESMLGASGRTPSLLELLEQETEGNLFLLVEVMRALAEDAGGLDHIGTMTLPQHIVTGGMKQLITRRLNRIPANAQRLLRIAATAGRQLDLTVIQVACDLAVDLEVNAWLAACADAAVLEVQEQVWRFSHDKLREGVLSALADDEKRALHSLVAQAIETAYPNNPRQTRALAYHWAAAANAPNEQKYAAQAAVQSLGTGAYRDARVYGERALALLPPISPDNATTGAKRVHAALEQTLGVTYIGLGSANEALSHLTQALTLLGYPMPAAGAALAGGLTVQLARQIGHRLLGTPLAKAPNRDITRTVSLLYEQLALAYYWQGKKMPATFAALATLNHSERIGVSPELVRAYANMSVAAGVVPIHWLAHDYARRAISTAQQVGDELSLAAALRICLAYGVGTGEWQVIEAQADLAADIAQRTVDYRVWGDALAHAQGIAWYQGKFARAEQYADILIDVAQRSENRQFNGWALTYEGQTALVRGDLEAALAKLNAAAQVLDALNDNTLRCICYGSLGLVLLWRGEPDRAQQILVDAAQAFADSSTLNYGITQAYADRAEVFNELLRQSPENAVLRELSHNACLAYERAARLFKIALPGSQRARGSHHWITGQQASAVECWNRALKDSQALHMSNEEGLIHLTVGRYTGQPERIEQARRIFAAIGAVYRVTQCDVALDLFQE